MDIMRSIPTISGWSVVEDEGSLVATRRTGLTDFQKDWGALPQVESRNADILFILCDAQTRLAERLATAEGLRPRISPHPKALEYLARGDQESSR